MKYKVGDIEFEIPKCPDPTKARNYGLPIEEQYWRREGFPEDWEFMSADDKWDFIAEDYRRKEEGFFFWNEGELTYITGDHFFHLEWWNGGIDDNDGYFGFRIADMEDFYFWEYCKQDPNCYGYMAVEGRRGGKALDINTEIPTTKGWKLMYEIKAGDYVFGSDGKPTKVAFISDIQYKRKCYNVKFSDGSEIVADGDHRWLAWDKSNRKHLTTPNRNVSPKVVTTSEMLAQLRTPSGESNWSIENCKPVNYSTKELKIPPYIFGLWLGDGSSHYSKLTNIDEEIIKAWIDYGTSVGMQMVKDDDITYMLTSGKGGRTNHFMNMLRHYSVLKNKHIPVDYLQSSVEDRKELLQGLMDTDGCKHKGSASLEYCSKSHQLISGVKELVESLGYKCTLTSKLNKKYNKTYYYIKFGVYGDDVFRLKRKQESVKKIRTGGWRTNHRYIVDIVPVETRPVKCIQVDNKNHTYLCGRNFVVTHNTERGLSKGYNLTTLGANRRMFIQSFTESDAKERLFIDTVVRSWRHIPSVLKPKDEGIKEPKKRLRFISRAGLRKDSVSKSLDSSIQFVAAKDSSLQGKKVSFVFPDEPASWDKIDLIKWWGITKKAMELGGKVRGKAILPATLENMNPIGGAAFWKLWNQSNFNKRDDNGRTESGLYRLFRPADENFELYINKYGKCDKEKARKFILNERATKTDESLINLIRQHPLSEEEAFGAISSSFWEEDVSAFLEEIKKNIVEAEFYGERKMVVATGDDTSLIETSDPNCYIEVFEDVQPNVQYCVGFDGSGSDNETGDEGGSDTAFVIMKKFESPRNNNYTDVANFTYRPKKMETVYNILFNLCKHYNKYGRLEILGETNAGQGAAVKSFFANRGGENMMAKQPKNIGFNKTKKTDKYWIYRTEDVIEVQKTLAHIFVRVYGMNMRSLRLVESLLRLGKDNQDLGDAWLMAILLMGDVTAEAKTYVPLPQRRKVRKLERSNGKLQYIWQEI